MNHPLSSLIPADARVLWVASSGGHFAQLRRIAASHPKSGGSAWVTFDTPQTRSALTDEQAIFVEYVKPRDVRATLRVAMRARNFVDPDRFDLCVSTGAALATAVLPIASKRGLTTLYVESITRVHGPSLTGKLLGRVRGVQKYTQHGGWASESWTYRGSILDSWASERVNPVPVRRIFVTLGTIKPYRFDRLIDAVASLLLPTDDVTWQLGCTTRTDLPGRVEATMSAQEMTDEMQRADVVVTHAGVGTIMQLLDLGVCPVIGVRDPRCGEHVDNHQNEIAVELEKRQLAVRLDLDSPRRQSFVDAGSKRINTNPANRSSGV